MLVLALLLGSSSLDHIVQSLLTRIARPSVAESLHSTCLSLCNCLEEKKREAPFGINLMRSQVLYRAAQGLEQVQLHKQECKVVVPVRLLQCDLS